MANGNSAKLAQQIWAIANSLRGNMDSSKFKDYILGVIFYRYLSAHTESYMDDLLRNDGVTYREALADPELAPEVRHWACSTPSSPGSGAPSSPSRTSSAPSASSPHPPSDRSRRRPSRASSTR